MAVPVHGKIETSLVGYLNHISEGLGKLHLNFYTVQEVEARIMKWVEGLNARFPWVQTKFNYTYVPLCLLMNTETID